jgi:hypothetical protein
MEGEMGRRLNLVLVIVAVLIVLYLAQGFFEPY